MVTECCRGSREKKEKGNGHVVGGLQCGDPLDSSPWHGCSSDLIVYDEYHCLTSHGSM